MRIYDILHSKFQTEDRIAERREKDSKDEHKTTGDNAKISTEAQSLYQARRDQKLNDVRGRIESGYYQRREVLEKVADAIYRVLNK